jgi:hypothetical protein
MLPGVQTDIAGPVLQLFIAKAPRKAMLIPKLVAEYFQEIFYVFPPIIFTLYFYSKEPTCMKK